MTAGSAAASLRKPSLLATLLFDRQTIVTLLVVAAAILIVPPFLDALWLRVLISSIIFTIAATGTAVLYARLGLVSLAQMALVGVGGWVTLRMWHATGLPFEINMLVAALIAAGVGMLIGLPALRMRGLFLALITLMAAAGFQILVTGTQFPNGGSGVLGIAVSSVFMPRPYFGQSDAAMLRYVSVVALLVFLRHRTQPASPSRPCLGADPQERGLRHGCRRQCHLLQGLGLRARRLRGRYCRRRSWRPPSACSTQPPFRQANRSCSLRSPSSAAPIAGSASSSPACCFVPRRRC